MVLEEALKLADEADKEGYLNRYPQATIALAKEVRRLKARGEVKKEEKSDRQAKSEACKGLSSYRSTVTGEVLKLPNDDPRVLSGEFQGVAKGSNSNKNGSLSGYVHAKDPVTGERFRIHKTDPRWISGELVGIRKGVKRAKDITSVDTVDTDSVKRIGG